MKEVQINSIQDIIRKIEPDDIDNFISEFENRLFLGITFNNTYRDQPSLEKISNEFNLEEINAGPFTTKDIYKDGFGYPSNVEQLNAFETYKKYKYKFPTSEANNKHTDKEIKPYVITDFNSMREALNYDSIEDFGSKVKELFLKAHNNPATMSLVLSENFIFEYTPKPPATLSEKVFHAPDEEDLQFIRKTHRFELKYLIGLSTLSEEIKDQLKGSYVVCDINRKLKVSSDGNFVFVPKENIQNNNYIILNETNDNS